MNKRMDDLISRQAAIDFIAAGHLCNPNEPRWSDNEVVNFLKSRPSAQPESQWIPVSERLPSDSGNYLITVADLRLGHIGEHTVTMADFYVKEKKWNSAVDVYAWMPLPEPYKAERGE